MSHLLELKDLSIEFDSETGKTVAADRVNLQIERGETLCIVGESGCGKSVTSLSVMGLLGGGGRVCGGSILFEGRNLLDMEEKELDTLRGNRISMIFQDPLTSLNPSFTVGYQITESIRTHMKLSRREASARAQQVLAQAGLPDPAGMMKKYPHTLSGGMRQRVMIAMALCCDPALLIADEPTTALDVTIQAQIMQLLRELKQKMNMSLWMITHDIGLVAGMADRVAVMYAGQIIEEAPVRELFHRPVHPYTASLLATVPGIYDEEDRVLASIPGIVPEHYDTIQGCRFADRCRFCTERCNAAQNVQTVSEAHTVRCCRWNEIRSTN